MYFNSCTTGSTCTTVPLRQLRAPKVTPNAKDFSTVLNNDVGAVGTLAQSAQSVHSVFGDIPVLPKVQVQGYAREINKFQNIFSAVCPGTDGPF